MDTSPREMREWYERNQCDHAHCPAGCDKPQPLMRDGVLICGKCAVLFGTVSPMVPCRPDVCD